MCGRYTLHKKAAELAKRFGLAHVPHGVAENFNVAPGQIMPVIIADEHGPKIEMMKWGLIPGWAKDPNIGYKLINARGDTIFDKSMWRKLILRQRALIPADGFYEWQAPAHPKERKRPFYIHPKHQDIFAFAGIWETWQDANSQPLKTFSIITTEPNREMRTIHNRMPVILYPEEETAWLDPAITTRDKIEPLLHSYHDGGLEMFEVSSEVNVARTNDARLIYPLNSTQAGKPANKYEEAT